MYVKLFIRLQHLIPQHGLSRAAGWLASTDNKLLKNTFINWFVKRYNVDMSLAAEENPLFYRFDTRPTFGMEIKTNELERTRSDEIWRWSSGQNHDNGYFQLLFEYTTTSTRIYKDQLKRYPRGGHHRIQLEKESNGEWEHLHQSEARYVRITTGWITS